MESSVELLDNGVEVDEILGLGAKAPSAGVEVAEGDESRQVGHCCCDGGYLGRD